MKLIKILAFDWEYRHMQTGLHVCKTSIETAIVSTHFT